MAPWRVSRLVPGLLLLALAIPASAGHLVGKAGPFGLDVTVTPDPPVVGANLVSVAVRQRGDQPVTAATVTVITSLTGSSMAAAPFTATAGTTPGLYDAAVNLPLSGTWGLEIMVSAGGQEGRQVFRLTTGNPIHQIEAAGRRTVWLWLLLMVAGPLIVALLPARVLRPERRGPVAGTVLLLAALCFARSVVQVYKRPGQMGVIESQAMDMSAMKPPIGLVPVTVETAALASFEGGVTYTGSVVPFAQQDVYPRVAGTVVDMPVYPGDHVHAGEVLARLDTRELGSRQNEAVLAHLAAQEAAGAARQDARSVVAAVDQAQSELAMADHKIAQMLAEKGSAEAMVRRSQQELVAAQARHTQALRNVDAARAGQRTKAAMSDEGKAMVRQAEADQNTGGSMVTEATAELAAAQHEVAEAEAMTAAAQAGRERAEASAAAMRAELPQAEADVRQMQADVTFEEVQLARMASLLKQGAVSQEEYDREKSMHDAAAAKVARAQAMVTGTRGKVASEEAMARQAGHEEAAAGERRGKAQAMVQAAQAKLGQARSELAGRGAMVEQRGAGVKSRAAEEDEAASMLAMRQAEVETMAADAKSAAVAIEQAQQEVLKADAGIAEMRSARERAAGMIRERQAMAAAATQRATEAANRAGQARAAAFTAETIAGYTAIKATLDGVVTERVTSPATLVQPGTLLLRVAQIDQVRLQANVAQSDASRLKLGAAVEITARKDQEHRDRAVVSAIFPASNAASRTQIVESRIDNSDGAYLPGDFVTLRIATGGTASVLSIPTRAVVHITKGDTGGVIAADQAAVWVVATTAAAGGATRTEYYCTMHPEIIRDKPGLCPKCKMELVPRQVPVASGAGGAAGAAAAKTEYYCTMHPDIVRDQPGLCPKCKMELVPRQAAATGAAGGAAPAAGQTEYYCPMHPEIVREQPGPCPICKMDLVPRQSGSGIGTAHRVAVTLGRTNGDRIEVLTGLQAGDLVIVAGFDNLRERDAVRVVAAPTTAGLPVTASGGRDRTPRVPAAAISGDSGAPAVSRAAAPVERSSPGARPAPPPPKTLYTCPMDPDVIRSAPGRCPKCGMDLVPKKAG